MSDGLVLENVTIRFGGLTAVSELNLRVDSRELLGLIGPNGAGKTTVFNLITGVYAPTQGDDHVQRPAHRPPQSAAIGAAGPGAHVSKHPLFGSLSVFDNVRAAVQLHRPHGVRDALWRGRGFYQAGKPWPTR
jgi:branched-chain amino acid transport system ATP-binding protein